VLTCGDVFRNPDDHRHRGVDGPDASLGCRKATGGRGAGGQGERQDGRQDRGKSGSEDQPPARPGWVRGGAHARESVSPARSRGPTCRAWRERPRARLPGVLRGPADWARVQKRAGKGEPGARARVRGDGFSRSARPGSV
jgi:hypothetical protein